MHGTIASTAVLFEWSVPTGMFTVVSLASKFQGHRGA